MTALSGGRAGIATYRPATLARASGALSFAPDSAAAALPGSPPAYGPSPPALTFPSLAGQGWSVHKKPLMNTIVAPHVSGRDVRFANWAYPLWEFEAIFNGLDSGSSYPGLGSQSLQNLMGFFLQCGGQLSTFLYTDPSDNTVTGQTLAIADGVRTNFPFVRSFGAFAEPVGWVTALTQVYLNGSPTSGWNLVLPNALVFAAPPLAGGAISADFNFAFQCRPTDDSLDFEEFMSGLWKMDSFKFRSVRTS